LKLTCNIQAKRLSYYKIMIKKILIGLIIAYGLFLLCGVALLYFAKIEKFTVIPGFSIKHTIHKKGVAGTDGPIVIYQDGKTIALSLGGEGKSLTIVRDTLTGKEVTCTSFQTGDTFSIKLKDSLKVEQDTYATPGKMLVLSDIEGNFKGLKMILRGTGVVNNKFDWAFGNGHLVIIGDFFDRGTDVAACLWLIYRLEEQALREGGKVHFILGNHEIMNLTGKYHYVNKRYDANADTINLPYKNWYNTNTELGRWLRTKNVVEKIGDGLYLHAGLSPEIYNADIKLNDLNRIARTAVDKEKHKLSEIEKLITGENGPYWYRGIAQEKIDDDQLDLILRRYTAGKMVIGHTILGDIQTIYQAKVIVIDLPHQENSDKGVMQALWYQAGKFYITNNQGQLKGL
jgi:hypothetical protein